jgi:hypothetical protein
MLAAPDLALGKVKGKIIAAGEYGAVIKHRHYHRVMVASTDQDDIRSLDRA